MTSVTSKKYILPIILMFFLLLGSCSPSSNNSTECDGAVLTVAFTDGVASNLTEGPSEYECSEMVSYDFSIQQGYKDLQVYFDYEPVESSGSIQVEQAHLLSAVATRIPVIRQQTQPIKETIDRLMTSSEPVKEYQSLIDQAFELYEANPDSARQWLNDVTQIVNANYSDEDFLRIDEELSGEMFFLNNIASSNASMIDAEANPSTRLTNVVFINGIWNTRDNAQMSSIELQRVTREAGLENYINSFIYNPTSKRSSDEAVECVLKVSFEHFLLAPISSWGTKILNECTRVGDLTESFKAMINHPIPPETSRKIAEQLFNWISEGGQIIVVAHSQGNLMIRDALESNDVLSEEMKKRISVISLAAPSTASTQKDRIADFDCWTIDGDIITIPAVAAGGGCDGNLMKTDYSEWLIREKNKNLVGSGGLGLIVYPPPETVGIHSTDNYFGVHTNDFTGRKQERERLKETLLKHQQTLFGTSSAIPPNVSTKSISDISDNSARSGGEISYDGGAQITQKGVCWSTSINPTLNDSCSDEGSGANEYTSTMSGLSSDTRYYVRAYATNSAGTGYGNQRNFLTQQEGQSYSISGTVTEEDGTPISDISMLLIQHNQSSNLSTSTDGSGFYIFENLQEGQDYSVAPQSEDDFEPSNMRFNNLSSNQTQDFKKVIGGNGGGDTQTEVVEVTSATGRVWMDRNLGASRAATSMTDEQAYGDLYQWGRAADGHQRRNSQTTSTLSSSDQPGHGSFILSNLGTNNDWRSPQNDNLWQGVDGINNPCPSSYRLPTDTEWEEEQQSWSSNDAEGAFASPLKLSLAGYRLEGLQDLGVNVGYWSSTVSYAGAQFLALYSTGVHRTYDGRANGFSVRCIKD